MALEKYRHKRSFEATPEPEGVEPNASRGGRFVVQMHAARRLHWDLRLEIDGVLRCWAVPRGPSLDPKDKRLAARTEDHPVEYLSFEKVIPAGNYGAGEMIIWDFGVFEPEGDLPAQAQLEKGELKFVLFGKKLAGGFVLVRTQKKNARDKKAEEWLLIKHRDAAVEPGYDISHYPESALSGRTLEELRDGVLPGAGAVLGPAAIEGAERSSMPDAATPMLASSLEKAFTDPDWVYELKWDGVRILAHVVRGKLRLISRNDRDVTSHYPELWDLPHLFRAADGVLDGEIVALDSQGRSDFSKLQSRMHVQDPSPVQIAQTPVVYYVFDLLYADGYDLRDARLTDRKQYLRQGLRPNDTVRYCDHIAARGEEFFQLAQQHGAEGILAKRADSRYLSTRSEDWLKIKILQELDVVVGGWTEPRGGREHFGALLVGLYDGSELRFAGGVGTGFDDAALERLASQLQPLESLQCPLAAKPKTKEPAHWVQPTLVARVRYTGWARDGGLRHPVYLGLRDDVEPADCIDPRTAKAAPTIVHAPRHDDSSILRSVRELELELTAGQSEMVRVELDGKSFRLTHLDKIYFPGAGYAKRDLLLYYFRVADRILPFLQGRPLVLHRFPNGIASESFYQKDAGEGLPDWMDTVSIPSEGRGRDIRYLVCNHLPALLQLANLGSIEQHPWPSRVDALREPDYVFFDLDPTETADFEVVLRVARAFMRTLRKIEIQAFIKTSGSRGIHIWVPLVSGYGYEHARSFAEIVARVVYNQLPDDTTLERVVDKRPEGTVYLDYSQNAYGRPLATVYSVRAKPGAPISTPLAETELRKGLRPTRFTIATIEKRLAGRPNLWSKFWQSRQRIEPALERLGRLLRV